jgi:uncharacterized RDD family membrane protein YckC
MERIAIETTQNVDIEYEVASVGERIVATIIDLLIMGGYGITISFIAGLVGYSMRDNMPGFYVVIFLLSLPILFYTVLFEIFLNGQTPGKSAMRIKVMRTDGRQPDIGNYLMRWMLRIIDIWLDFGVVAIVTVVINGQGQRLGDIAAGTLVIKLKAKQAISNTAFEKVEEAYIPVFPEAIKLTDRDASTIKQVLRMTVSDTEEIALLEGKLAEKLKEVLGVQSSLSDRQFLQTVLKDYNHTSGKL